jgi:hypothetical protein
VLFCSIIGVLLSVERLQPKEIYLKIISAITILTIVLNIIFWGSGPYYRDFPLTSILSNKSKDTYLLNNLPIRNAVNLVNKLNTNNTPIGLFGDSLVGGLSSKVLFPNWYNHNWERSLWHSNTEYSLSSIFYARDVEYLIVDSNFFDDTKWTKDKLNVINKISTPISQFGSVSVRRVNQNYSLTEKRNFKNELLINPDFSSTKGWNLNHLPQYDELNKIMRASVLNPVTQIVSVHQLQEYLVTVTSRCIDAKTTGRVQVNWLNAEGKMLQTSIRVFECESDWKNFTLEVVAPLKAVSAIVFATGHSNEELEFNMVSLKK